MGYKFRFEGSNGQREKVVQTPNEYKTQTDVLDNNVDDLRIQAMVYLIN